MNDLTIGPGTQVTMHFSLSLEDGTVVDSNFEGDPVTFTVGDGNLMPGFEQALYGLSAGEEHELVIPPEQGFGQHNASNVQTVDRSDFPADVPLEEGLVMTFADAQNNELPGVVVSFDETTVNIDFNHPLAGRDVTFSVKILDVVPAITH